MNKLGVLPATAQASKECVGWLPAPMPNTLDNGYFTEEAVEELGKMGMDSHIGTSRQIHNEAPAPLVAGAPPAHASVKEQMRLTEPRPNRASFGRNVLSREG